MFTCSIRISSLLSGFTCLDIQGDGQIRQESQEVTVGIAQKMIAEDWDHSPAEMEIEDIVALNPGLARRMERLALRFISLNGLTDEFTKVIKEIEGLVDPEKSITPLDDDFFDPCPTGRRAVEASAAEPV